MNLEPTQPEQLSSKSLFLEQNKKSLKQDFMITEVKTKKDYKAFLDFPHTLYFKILKSKHYIMPLKLMTKLSIGKVKSQGKHLLLAKKANKVVARLGIKTHKTEGVTKLHFGFFECVPDAEDVVQGLFDHARSLYPHLEMIGPYSFRMEDPYMGLLLRGYDQDPYFMMAYNPAYYVEYFKSLGLKKVMEVYAYNALATTILPKSMYDKAQNCMDQGFQLRWMTQKTMKADVRSIAKIFNDALSENWGFEELIDQQVKDLFLLFKFFVDPDFVGFVTKDGQDVGCLIMLPNFSPCIKKAQGKITPQLIYDIFSKKKTLDQVRGYALGIKKDFHGMGLGSLLVSQMWDKCVGPERGYKETEISWILGNNSPMKALAEQMDGKPDKAFGVFEKEALNPHQ